MLWHQQVSRRAVDLTAHTQQLSDGAHVKLNMYLHLLCTLHAVHGPDIVRIPQQRVPGKCRVLRLRIRRAESR